MYFLLWKSQQILKDYSHFVVRENVENMSIKMVLHVKKYFDFPTGLAADGLGLYVVDILPAVADGELVAALPAPPLLLLLLLLLLYLDVFLLLVFILSKLSQRSSNTLPTRKENAPYKL